MSGPNGSTPGQGWSNGDVAPQMFPITQDGRMQLYGSNRRWIGLHKGWTRIGGEGATEFDDRHSTSAKGESTVETPEHEAQTVRALISQLCENFYKNQWATGTGGGVSIRVGGPSENRPWRVFVAPSGIQKEDMIGDDIFELDMNRNIVVPPKTPNLRQSACTPLWYVVYKERPSAVCVIHTHSMHAQMATLLDPTEKAKSLKITHLEMLKGVGNHAYDDVLEVPIIDNRPSEDQLADQLREAVRSYPKCNAVLVRRHGLYAWGDSWEQAKTQCESFDYLFQSAVQMKSMGIDCARIPTVGTYRVSDEDETMPSPPTKRAKTDDAAAGFNASQGIENGADLLSNAVPILPRDAKILLLDIEGCTTSISFVHSVLFPYAREHLGSFLQSSVNATEKEELLEALSKEVREVSNGEEVNQDIVSLVHFLMDRDVKSATLKMLQGKIWKAGYASGELKAHVYDDIPPTLQWMKQNGVKCYIYSSGSIGAQKLLFGHTEAAGNLLDFFEGHFDIPTAGPKKEADSYTKIAKSMGVAINEIVFVSDLTAELEAASSAGMKYAIQSIRPGNAPIGEKSFPSVHSLLQLCGK
eukprot:CAMPEP_0172447276 /NCGR_PEP_ID=MMETSP1065-20121228/6605_1 /TAXON_ID=265537 /ORGANISM="Amphiprora paludosa, Strain CCMP125" /LENGTH=583 /DNA_ID=CAMNT_0013198523 /DNA_START=6 /DNA_END=1757 /DNA_ORIENTATION=-